MGDAAAADAGGAAADGVLAEVAARFGVPAAGVRLLPAQGVANATYALGERWVLRVARPGYEADLAKEAALLPVVRDAGLPVPALLEHGAGGPGRRLHVVLERCRGASLDATDLPDDVRREGYRDLGRVLRRLHAARLAAPPGVDADDPGDLAAVVEDLRVAGWIGTAEADWLRAWTDWLARWCPRSPGAVVLHGDAAPQNVLVDPASGRVRALLDWGDAAVSDPAVDLAKVPPRFLPDAVAGYVERPDCAPSPASPDDERAWGARALRHHVSWALGRLPTGPRSGDAAWSAPPAARLLGVVQLALHPPTPAWTELLPPRPGG